MAGGRQTLARPVPASRRQRLLQAGRRTQRRDLSENYRKWRHRIWSEVVQRAPLTSVIANTGGNKKPFSIMFFPKGRL